MKIKTLSDVTPGSKRAILLEDKAQGPGVWTCTLVVLSSVPVASSRLRALEAQQLHLCWPCIREALGESTDSERMEAKKSWLFSELTYIPSAACQASAKHLKVHFSISF